MGRPACTVDWGDRSREFFRVSYLCRRDRSGEGGGTEGGEGRGKRERETERQIRLGWTHVPPFLSFLCRGTRTHHLASMCTPVSIWFVHARGTRTAWQRARRGDRGKRARIVRDWRIRGKTVEKYKCRSPMEFWSLIRRRRPTKYPSPLACYVSSIDFQVSARLLHDCYTSFNTSAFACARSLARSRLPLREFSRCEVATVCTNVFPPWDPPDQTQNDLSLHRRVSSGPEEFAWNFYSWIFFQRTYRTPNMTYLI